MIKRIGQEITIIEADKGKYLAEQGKEPAGKLIRAIYFNDDKIPEFEERNLKN